MSGPEPQPLASAQAVTALSALAHDTRLAIFRALVTAGPDGLPAGRLAGDLGVPGPTLSFHLKELERAGLTVARRDRRQIFYSAHFAAMRGLIDFLMRDCCQGHPEACGAAAPACSGEPFSLIEAP